MGVQKETGILKRFAKKGEIGNGDNLREGSWLFLVGTLSYNGWWVFWDIGRQNIKRGKAVLRQKGPESVRE